MLDSRMCNMYSQLHNQNKQMRSHVTKMGIIQTFAMKLKAARKDRGYSQEELAKIVGVSRRIVSDWENAKASPPLERLERLAIWLNKPVSYFLSQSKDFTGHFGCDLKAYVSLYNQTIHTLRQRQVEAMKIHETCESLIAHFGAQATLLVNGELSQAERDEIKKQLDPEIDIFAGCDVIFSKDPEFPIALSERDLMDGAATQAFLALAGMNERVELSVAPNDPELEELKAETGQSVKVAKRLIEDQYRENPFKLFEFQLEYFVRQRMNEARKLLVSGS